MHVYIPVLDLILFFSLEQYVFGLRIISVSNFQTISDAYRDLHKEGETRVTGYSSHSTIRVRPAKQGAWKSYDFVEACVNLDPFGELRLKDRDFEKAYKAAGRKFIGAMRDTFIVLRDDSPHVTKQVTVKRDNANLTPIGAKTTRSRLEDKSMESEEM